MSNPAQFASRDWLYRATAEFFVVVVGVFVALLLENWWSAQQERALEAVYIEALYLEAQSHITALNDNWNANGTKRASLEEAARLLDGPFVPEKTRELVHGLLQGSGIAVVPELSDEVFSDLQSSGRLHLIRNDELRRAVIQQYSAIPPLLQRAERWAEAVGSDLHAFISRRTPFGVVRQSGPYLEIVWGDIGEEQIREIGAEIHSAGEVRGYVNAQARQLEAERNVLDVLSQRFQEYVTLFEETDRQSGAER